MKKVIRLTESDLTRLIKRVINEQTEDVFSYIKKVGFKPADEETTRIYNRDGKIDNLWMGIYPGSGRRVVLTIRNNQIFQVGIKDGRTTFSPIDMKMFKTIYPDPTSKVFENTLDDFRRYMKTENPKYVEPKYRSTQNGDKYYFENTSTKDKWEFRYLNSRKTFQDMGKVNNNSTKPKSQNWPQVIKYVQKYGAFDDFKFNGFTEGIQDAGIELRKGDLNMRLDPDGKFGVYRNGRGLYDGTWTWENDKLVKKTENKRYSQ